MLASHLNAIEQILIAQSVVAKNAGHPNLRGGPREWFLREFLEGHLPSTLEIGQGEIIDAESEASPPRDRYRHQVDIVVYRRDVPKITFSRNNAAFLVEGVMATIESKSVLTEEELKSACRASISHKRLTRDPVRIQFGRVLPHVVSYVVAFDGPANISTVANWLQPIANELSVIPDRLVEMVVVLGKGVVWRIDAFPELPVGEASTGHHWAFIQQPDKNLFMMFAHMFTWAAGFSPPPSALAYARHVDFTGIEVV